MKQPLVLLPGLLCDAALWEPQLSDLANSEAMAQAIAQAKLVVLEECGHVSTLERPQEVNRAMRGGLSGEAK